MVAREMPRADETAQLHVHRFREAGSAHQIHDVAAHGVVNINLVYQVAGGRHLFRRGDRGGFRRFGGAGHEVQHLEFFFARGVGDQHRRENGQAGLPGAGRCPPGQSGSAWQAPGRVRQAVGGFTQGYLAFLHGFQQGGLHFGRGAVDFIRQNEIGEDRAFLAVNCLSSGL